MPEDVLRVICAGGFRPAMQAMLAEVETSLGATLELTYGTPARTRELVSAGEGFDVALVTLVSVDATAGAALMDAPRFTVARSCVGMGFHPSRGTRPVGTPADLIAALRSVATVGLSDPSVGTNLGADLVAAADRLGFGDLLRSRARFVMGPGSVVSAEVAKGALDAVITLASEIVTVPGVAYAGPIPDAIGIDFPFLAGVARAAADAAQALRFIGFLRGPAARRAMERSGLEPALPPSS